MLSSPKAERATGFSCMPFLPLRSVSGTSLNGHRGWVIERHDTQSTLVEQHEPLSALNRLRVLPALIAEEVAGLADKRPLDLVPERREAMWLNKHALFDV